MKSSSKSIMQLVIGLLSTAVLLYFLFQLISFEEFSREILSSNLYFSSLAIVSFLAANFFNSFRWKVILRSQKFFSLSLYQLFQIICMSFMLNNLLPARVGEIAKVFFLVRKGKAPFSTGITTVVAERFFDMLNVLVIMVGSVFFLDLLVPMREVFPEVWVNLLQSLQDRFPQLGKLGSQVSFNQLIEIPFYIALSLSFLGLSVMFFFRGYPEVLIRSVQKFLFWIDKNSPIFEKLRSYSERFQFFSHPKRLLKIFFASSSVWIGYTFSFYFFVQAFGLPIHFWETLFLMGVVAVAISLPLTPGGLGTFELLFVLVGVLLSGPEWQETIPRWISCAIVAHVSQILILSTLGLFFFFRQNYSFREILKSKNLQEKQQ